MKRKVLVWIACVFVFSVARTAVQMSGITLGGLPTALIAVALVFVPAPLICKALDKREHKQYAEPVDKWYTCPKCGQLVREGEVCDCEAVRSALEQERAQEQEQPTPRRRSVAWPLTCTILAILVCVLGYYAYICRWEANDLARINRQLNDDYNALSATVESLHTENIRLLEEKTQQEKAATREEHEAETSYERWKQLHDDGLIDATYEEYLKAAKGFDVRERAALQLEWGKLHNAGLTALTFEEWLEAVE